MIQLTDKTNCCGCTACMSICPHNAITMHPDELGFKYPIVDLNKCTNCGLCEKVCNFKDDYDRSTNLSIPLLYAVRHKDNDHLMTSRSGAAFIAISDFILKKRGNVYGATFDNDFTVKHKKATTFTERDTFKGSKYVQSDLNTVFLQIKKDLQEGFSVLFSGTPCQTAGLKSFIPQKLQKNLILVDIICHGVPAPKIWDDYLCYIHDKYKKDISIANFRDKSELGWNSHVESFRFTTGEKIYRKTWTTLFYSHIMFRPACKNCHYTNTTRPSDFTIADYWGIEKLSISFNADNKGCSLLFINTQKGIEIFEEIKNDINILPTEINLCMQPNMQHPSRFHADWKDFQQNYPTKGFIWAAKKYGDLGINYKIRTIKKTLKSAIYPFYKAILKR